MSFDQAFALTVSPSVEGGYSCVSSDPGNWSGGKVGSGELLGTNMGISAAFLSSLPTTDPYHQAEPAALKVADVEAIYRAHFWDAVQADKLAPPVGGLLFDAAVNQGPSWAPRLLQGGLGVTADGILGPKTLAAAAAADPSVLHAEIGRLRDARYRADPDWPVFGVGWSRRLMTVVAATASFTADPVAATRLLGRLPAKRDPRVPALGAIAPTLPPAPERFTDYVDAVDSWILGANDRVGDCTCVAPANIILALTTMAKRPVRLADAAILAFYGSVSGYDPANPATDRGAIVEDVLAAWHARGIAGDRLDGYASLELNDHERVRQAIAHLGPVDLGVNLPVGWQSASTWDVSTAGRAIAGGHSVTAVGYTEGGPLIVSWGQVFSLTWAGWDAFLEEAHVLLSRDALLASGKDAEGIDWAALEAFMARIRAS